MCRAVRTRAGLAVGLATWLLCWTASGSAEAQAPEPAEAVVEPPGQADPAGEADPDPESMGPLRVAVAGSEPFVVQGEDGELTGFSVQMWEAIGDEYTRARDAQLVPVESVSAALRAVSDGRADVALGPITITAERTRRVSFTQPYFFTSLAIMAPATQSLWARLAPFATRAFAAGLLLLLVVLGGVGALLWLAERRANPEQFPGRPVPGIASGIWLALVTMTTVGYGDMAPVTRRGRVVAGVWMLLAMLTASSLTASIATALTLSQLETPGLSEPSDLKGKPIAAVDPSPAADFVRETEGRVVGVPDVEAGIAAVEDGAARALVGDRPVLSHHLRDHPDSELTLSPSSYRSRGYGIATRHDDPRLGRALDLSVLRLLEGGVLERLERRWLPQ